MKIQVLALLYQSPKSSRKFFLFSLGDQNPNGGFIALEKRYANLIETFPTPHRNHLHMSSIAGKFPLKVKNEKRSVARQSTETNS